MPKHQPIRMCLGCKERLPRQELVRLQLTPRGAQIIEHSSRIRQGRSIYICPKLGCADRAMRNGELVFKRSKYDKIIVRLEPKQVARLRYQFAHAARRLRGEIGVGPKEKK
jgi:predicted RNA-binding protein YlxR (DUF448 family)